MQLELADMVAVHAGDTVDDGQLVLMSAQTGRWIGLAS